MSVQFRRGDCQYHELSNVRLHCLVDCQAFVIAATDEQDKVQYIEWHYCDVMMGTMASQITGLTIVCSTIHLGADQRKHHSSASLAFVQGIHRLRAYQHLIYYAFAKVWLVSNTHSNANTQRNLFVNSVLHFALKMSNEPAHNLWFQLSSLDREVQQINFYLAWTRGKAFRSCPTA